MKNVNKILSDCSATQRALIYFENLCIESVKEGTGVAGFLSKLEQANLLNTFNSESEQRVYNQFYRAYQKLTTALDKLLIQRLTFEMWAESYFWIKVCDVAQTSLLETINETLFDNQTHIDYDNSQPKEAIKKIYLGQLYRCGGLFEIEPDKTLNLSEKLPLIKCATIDKLVRVKSCIHAIKTYITEVGFEIELYKDLINQEETVIINLCSSINANYSDVNIDENYSAWFKRYFLDC